MMSKWSGFFSSHEFIRIIYSNPIFFFSFTIGSIKSQLIDEWKWRMEGRKEGKNENVKIVYKHQQNPSLALWINAELAFFKIFFRSWTFGVDNNVELTTFTMYICTYIFRKIDKVSKCASKKSFFSLQKILLDTLYCMHLKYFVLYYGCSFYITDTMKWTDRLSHKTNKTSMKRKKIPSKTL